EQGALLPEEPTHLAVALAGTVRRRPVEEDRPVDPFDALDVLHEVFDALEVADGGTEAATRPGFDPARAAAVVVDGEEVGVVGELDPPLLRALELAPPVVGFEVDLDRLLGPSPTTRWGRSAGAASTPSPASTTPNCAVDVRGVRPPRPTALCRSRRPGRGVQRALADVLRRGVHPVVRDHGFRPEGGVLP